MRYDFFTLSLLAALEEYIPYMSQADLIDILEFGAVPSASKIRLWELRKERDGDIVQRAVCEAIARQK